MTAKRSRKSLWWGLLFLGLGLAGILLTHQTGFFQTVPFSGWGTGGYLDKGSYASNGERIYYLGLDGQGKRIRTRDGPHWMYKMGGGCVNCHGTDGKGGFPVMMGTKIPHDIRYASLTSGEHGQDEGKARETYTDEDIARAIREGIEPSGEALDRTMPRWNLSPEDMADLITYLKEL